MNAPPSKLEALHAEMLGDLQQVHQLLGQLREDMPTLMAGLKTDADKASAEIRNAFLDFHGQGMALAEFIKARKTEVLRDIEHATVSNAAITKSALDGFTKYFWLLAALGVFDLAALLVLVARK
jgi:predicted RNA-binding Zn ribbon-like protein